MHENAGVLIVSASAGAGHVRAGDALHRAFSLVEPALRVEHVDILELAPRWVRSAVGGGFDLMAARAPWLWEQIYRRTDGPLDYDARWGILMQRTLFREFRRLLLTDRWSACVCTHFLPAQLAAGRAGLPPFAVAITDFVLHRYWLQPGVDQYFVATAGMAADLILRAPWAAVLPTGIPVDPEFGAAPERSAARVSLGLRPDRPVALVMGGGLGLGVEASVDAALRCGVPDLQTVAVCGRNSAAARRLRALDLAPDRLQVHGFVPQMPRLMAAADVVVTKPGGLTASEALAVQRPLLLTRPIPGQEEGNTRALVAAGAALAAGEPAVLRDALAAVFGQAGLLDRLSAGARAIGRPDAACRIASHIRHRHLRDRAA